MNNEHIVFGIIVMSFFGTLAMAQAAGAASTTSTATSLSAIKACGTAVTLYVGNSISCGAYKVKLFGLSPYGCTSIPAPASFNIYTYGVLTNSTQIAPYNSGVVNAIFPMTISVGNTHTGNYKNAKWAQFGLSASSCSAATNTIYVGSNEICGPYTVQLADIGQSYTCSGTSGTFGIYYQGVLTNTLSILPFNSMEANDMIFGAPTPIFVHVGNEFLGLYKYQKWAKVTLTK